MYHYKLTFMRRFGAFFQLTNSNITSMVYVQVCFLLISYFVLLIVMLDKKFINKIRISMFFVSRWGGVKMFKSFTTTRGDGGKGGGRGSFSRTGELKELRLRGRGFQFFSITCHDTNLLFYNFMLYTNTILFLFTVQCRMKGLQNWNKHCIYDVIAIWCFYLVEIYFNVN